MLGITELVLFYLCVVELHRFHNLILTLATTMSEMVPHLLIEMHVHAWSCLPTHVAIQTERCSWPIQYMCKVPFGSHCIIPSHCTPNLQLIHNYKAPCLWNESHITLKHAFLSLSLQFNLRHSASLYQHPQHFSWQQNTRHSMLTNEKWEHSTVTSYKPALETKHSLLQSLPGFDLGHKSAGG